MQSHLQHIQPLQPQAFNYSLDWRFLLPITDMGKLLIAFEDDTAFSRTLEHIGVSLPNQLSFPDFPQKKKSQAHALVLPFGLSARWVGAHPVDQIELYRSIRGWIDPGGYVLVGFNNSWYSLPGAHSKYHPSTPQRVADQLHNAGFKSIEIFGAIPKLSIPEYIFHLEPQAVYFALRHRFRRKPVVLNVLRSLSRISAWTSIPSFLPCYFAVAVA
ncbi:MAG TPA: hypothetical protein VMN99_11665 [Anaerolineales bacterium]|nr:hypothetical protein [Anaerolineales bacterium]